MATQIFSEKVIVLQDETEVIIRPLVLGRLRRFMKVWRGFENVADEGEDNDKSFDIFINCAGICLEHEFKDKFPKLLATEVQAKKGEVLSPEYKEYLESVLDIDTIYELVDVCAGMKLNDPNLLAAAARMTEDGTA